MQYKGFYIDIKAEMILRTDTSGEKVFCHGFTIEIFDVSEKSVMIDTFTAAVGYELLKNSLTEAEQFVKDYISMEEKELRRLVDEYHKYAE